MLPPVQVTMDEKYSHLFLTLTLKRETICRSPLYWRDQHLSTWAFHRVGRRKQMPWISRQNITALCHDSFPGCMSFHTAKDLSELAVTINEMS